MPDIIFLPASPFGAPSSRSKRLDASGNVVWASGRTNSVGAIVKGTSEEILPTEFFYDPATRKQVLQPHHETITDEGQVQIYEELIADTKGKITTSFVGLDQSPEKQSTVTERLARETDPSREFTRPHGEAERDPEYINSSGATGRRQDHLPHSA